MAPVGDPADRWVGAVLRRLRDAGAGRSTRARCPFGTAAAWLDRWLIVVVLCSFIPLFLLFPDGRVALTSLATGPLARDRRTDRHADRVRPDPRTGDRRVRRSHRRHGDEPARHRRARVRSEALTLIGGFATFLMRVPGGAPRSSCATALATARCASRLGGSPSSASCSPSSSCSVHRHRARSATAPVAIGRRSSCRWFLTLVAGMPIACGVAILKYRLYDLDVVVRKTVVFGLLAAVHHGRVRRGRQRHGA